MINRIKYACYILFGAMIFGNLQQGDASKIASKIDTESKPAGSTGMLNCTLLSRSRAQLVWQKLEKVNGVESPVMYSIDEKIVKRNRQLDNGKMKYEILLSRAEQKGWTFTLVIRALTSDDAGEYRCLLLIDGVDHNRFPFQDGLLVVQSPPLLDKSVSTMQIDAIEGRDAILHCKATGNPVPSISWSRPNGVALPGGGLTLHGDTLRLDNITEKQTGLYRCKADNNVRPPSWLDIPVRVFHRPQINPFRKAVGQAPDKNYQVELSCIVKADPKPELSWWQEGTKRILDDNKHEVQKFDFPTGIMTTKGNYMTSMRINNVQSGDYGNYTCMAENIYGKKATTITLFYTPTCQGANCLFELRSNSGVQIQGSYLLIIAWAAMVYLKF
ncbi:lachesin-like [Lineus longissimus]|uniref:lachesin-like n=1 Tax=Lineus longissimus TaxID=88925 RepID=UPI002B4C9A24